MWFHRIFDKYYLSEINPRLILWNWIIVAMLHRCCCTREALLLVLLLVLWSLVLWFCCSWHCYLVWTLMVSFPRVVTVQSHFYCSCDCSLGRALLLLLLVLLPNEVILVAVVQVVTYCRTFFSCWFSYCYLVKSLLLIVLFLVPSVVGFIFIDLSFSAL